MRLPALIVGLFLTTVGVVGLVSPHVLAMVGQRAITRLYVVAALRIVIGLVLLGAAPASRLPLALRIVGIVAIVAGLATPFFGYERSRSLLIWAELHGQTFMRGAATVALAIGGLITYAVTAGRRAA
jgi:hypothetical protein